MFRKYCLIQVAVAMLFGLSVTANARAGSSSSNSGESKLTYDLGASSGSYNGASYSEINIGLNWFLSDWMIWRNSLFSRMSSVSDNRASGLDSSLRFQVSKGDSDFGLQAFAGPGYRFSSSTQSAVFAEAGATVKIKGLSLGLGAKVMNYTSPGQDAGGADRPKQDTSYFIILGGGGSL